MNMPRQTLYSGEATSARCREPGRNLTTDFFFLLTLQYIDKNMLFGFWSITGPHGVSKWISMVINDLML